MVEPVPSYLEMHGDVYINSCTRESLLKLKKEFFELKIRDASQAWKIVEILLCGDPNNRNKKFIRAILAPRIQSLEQATASDDYRETIDSRKVDASQFFSRKHVFAASASGKGRNFEVGYTPNEACVESRKFRHVKNTWRLVAVGGACD